MRVIGLGQRAAGDDGVGLAVLAALREAGVPEDVELVEVAEAAALVPLLATSSPVILLDAVLGESPGSVRVLRVDALDPRALSPVSTHGLSVPQAIQLARRLHPETVPANVWIIGVTIAHPRGQREGLSPEVAAAVPRAAALALAAMSAGT